MIPKSPPEPPLETGAGHQLSAAGSSCVYAWGGISRNDFVCQSCGYAAPADYTAALNI